jgi:hypothetical protein
MESLTLDEVRALPAAVGLVTAGRVLGVGRTKAHEMVRNGTWPTRVLRIGNAYRIPTSDLLALLEPVSQRASAQKWAAMSSHEDPHERRRRPGDQPDRLSMVDRDEVVGICLE